MERLRDDEVSLNMQGRGQHADHLDIQFDDSFGGFGTHPAIQTAEKAIIHVTYKAQFDHYGFLALCGREGPCPDHTRKYFHVHENGYEVSRPMCCTGLSLCSDPLAGSHKYFFDQGMYYNRTCVYTIGCIQGEPSPQPNNAQYVCCGKQCGDFANGCMECYWTTLCGDRVRYLPGDAIWFCIPTRSNACMNFGGLCGIESGTPFPCCMLPLEVGLRRGSAYKLVDAMNSARLAWRSRMMST